jgi:hypothetical protein
MRRRTTLLHTFVAALAVTALAASPALARPADRIDRFDYQTPAETTSAPQDLRGERAMDAARDAQSQSTPATTKPVRGVVARETGMHDDSWYVLAIGLAASGIAAACTAGLARRNRLRARRAIA